MSTLSCRCIPGPVFGSCCCCLLRCLSTRLYSGAGLCYARLLVTHLQKSLRYNHHSTHFTSPSPHLPLLSSSTCSPHLDPGTTNTHRGFPKEVPDLFSVPCLVHLFLLFLPSKTPIPPDSLSVITHLLDYSALYSPRLKPSPHLDERRFLASHETHCIFCKVEQFAIACSSILFTTTTTTTTETL